MLSIFLRLPYLQIFLQLKIFATYFQLLDDKKLTKKLLQVLLFLVCSYKKYVVNILKLLLDIAYAHFCTTFLNFTIHPPEILS